MFADVMAYARKPLSVVMAGLLALLLVPVVPGAPTGRAEAATGTVSNEDFESTTTNAAGLVTAGVLNNHAAGDVTFTQTYDKDAILAADTIDSENLKKPTVQSDDATLTSAAQSAAQAAVDKVAQSASEEAALVEVSKNEASLKADAETAGKARADEIFQKPDSVKIAEAAAKAKAEEAHPGATVSDVKIKMTDKGAYAATATLDGVTLAAKSAGASGAVVDVDSAKFIDTADTPLTWEFDKTAFGVTTNGVSATAPLGFSSATGSDCVMKVTSAGTSIVTVPFTYSWKVTGASYVYTYSYQLAYTPTYEYATCTYGFDFTYTYTDSDKVVKTDQKGSVSEFSLNEKPKGDLDAVQDETLSGVSGSGTFGLDYTPQDATVDGTGSFSYEVAVTNLFTDTFSLVESHALVDTDAFTYNDEAKRIPAFKASDFAAGHEAAARQFLGDAPVISTTNGFEVVYDKMTGELVATPKNVTVPAGESVTVTWTLPDKTLVVHTVIAAVNPLEINYAVDDQPFRLEGSQQQHVLDAANASVRSAVNAIEKAAGKGDISADYYDSVTFATYDGQGAAAQNPALNLVPKQASVGVYANYKIVDLASVNVGKMKAAGWASTDLQLVATTGTSSQSLTSTNASSQWINSRPKASWASYTLAYATKGVPSDAGKFVKQSELSGGDGIHQVELYAMDGDGVVCQVTDVSYMLDTQAPKLKGSAASAPQKSATFGGVLFGDAVVNVDLTVADEAKANGSETTDKLEVKASGVNVGATKAWYSDAESGQSHIEASLNRDKAPLYSFAIEGDKDVATSSIEVQAVDNAGNVMSTTADQAVGAPMEYQRLVADASAPHIGIDWDTYDARNGRYYQTNRTLTLTVSDEFFNYVVEYENSQVVTTISQDGQAVIAVHPSDFTEVSANVWQYTLSFTVDADWEVTTPTVSDIIGRTATASGDSFTVDKTNPTMEVSFDNNNVSNGMYYNAARTATVTVTEHNFSSDLVNLSPTASAGNDGAAGSPSIGGWSTSGDVHTVAITFPGEGVYAMTIDGMDLAQNTMSSYSCEQFTVDTVAPTVEISGVEGMQAYSGAAQPHVAVHDTNVDTSTSVDIAPVGLNAANPYVLSRSDATTDVVASYNNPEAAAENDGVYTMIVQAKDLAGNTKSDAVTWSVNRFGSTYVLSDDTGKMINSYLPFGKVKNVQIVEINPSELDKGKTSVELTKGTNNSTLKQGDQYGVEEAVAGVDGAGWYTYTYTVSRQNFDGDGLYRVLLHSQDKASNVSENTMANKNKDRTGTAEVSFAVDDTAPLCNFVSLASDQTYEATSHTAQITFDDNIKLDHATVLVSDERGATLYEKALTADDLKDSSVQDVELSENAAHQKVSVVAYDAAGNRSDELVAEGVLVNSDPVVLWRNNTPLFVGSIVGGVAVLALAGVGIGFAVRKRRLSSSDANRAA